MTSSRIIKKYGLGTIEQNGRIGVVTSRGKLNAADIDYIKSHKAEIMAIINANKFDPKPVTLTAADLARQQVDELEAKYEMAQRHGVAGAIAARNAYEQALRDWQAEYPAEAASSEYSSAVRYNDGATNNPWTG